jgi:hypothetical protein
MDFGFMIDSMSLIIISSLRLGFSTGYVYQKANAFSMETSYIRDKPRATRFAVLSGWKYPDLTGYFS